MAVNVLKDVTILVGGYDISTQMSSLAVAEDPSLKTVPRFKAEGQQRVAGVPMITAQFEGFYEAGAGKVDTVLDGLKATDVEISASEREAEGDIAYTFRGMIAGLRREGPMGEPFRLSVSFDGSAGTALIRGQFLHRGAEAGNDVGAATQLGAVAEGQRVYAALHVLAVDGTLTVKVASDSAEAFDQSPEDQITFAGAAAVGSQWGQADGEITDDWWRIEWTIAGGAGTATFDVIVGIQ